MRYVGVIPFLIGSATVLVSCSPSLTGVSEIAAPVSGATDAGGGVKKSSMDVNKYPVTKTVCDPFGDSPDPRSNQGLKAELWWLEAGTARQSNVGAMIAKGQKSERSLFFSQLNVATRMFDQGFANETGSTVKSDDGTTLIEYFALRFKSILKLSPLQKPAMYEFAILSDDGAILNLRGSDGVYRANVNNDGDHPTRLGCGITPVSMNAETEIPMYLDYYQGPRYHISMVVLMREYKSDREGLVSGHDPACGLAGNSTWFDPNNASKPQQAYKDLLGRGWVPVAKENYNLANEFMFNPCKNGETPVISNFQILERFNDGFIVTWNTDIPATSQVVTTDPSGVQSISVSDNILRTTHQIRTTGQIANTMYEVQGVSISDTYGRAMSAPISARADY